MTLAGASPDHLALSGQGVRDVTRVAAGDPDLYSQIISGNASAVLALLEELRGEEAWTALARLSDRIIPARTGEVRDMTAKEGGATVALALPIEDGGWLLKTRTGGVGTEACSGLEST